VNVKQVPDAVRESFKARPHVWVLIAVLVVALFVAAHMFRYVDCRPEYVYMRCIDRWTGKSVLR
jgi:hypothetical protein